jgi:hypothetical protein
MGGCQMKLGFLTACLPKLSLEQIADWAVENGYEALEVAAWPDLGERPFIATHLNVEIILSDTYIVNNLEDKKIIRKYNVKNFKEWHLRLGISPPHPSCFIKKSVYLQHGLFDSIFKYASDFELLFRFIYKKKIRFVKLKTPTALMSSGGLSNQNFLSINLIY